MGSRWHEDRRRDPYFRDAKKQGYRARSAFKLKQLNNKHRVIKKGQAVVDLGCAPGGWSQVLLEMVGEDGFVAGVDLLRTRPIEGVTLLQGDFTKESTRQRLKDKLADAGHSMLDVVVSDMAPDMSGNYDLDQARSVYLCTLAMEFADAHLRPGGNFVCKVFEGADFQEFRELLRSRYRQVRMDHPAASRKASSEVYLVGKGFLGSPDDSEE